MRTNLITHFHCSNCGHQLNVEYDKEDSPQKIELPSSQQTEPEPPGAYCRYNRILVEPCRFCIAEKTGPAEKLIEAMDSLRKVKKGMPK